MQPRRLRDHDAVDVDHAVTGLGQHGDRPLEQSEAGGALELGVVGREVSADVTQAGRAEERVDDSVGEHVRVRVAIQAGRVLDSYTAQHERAPRRQRVDVVADADSHRIPTLPSPASGKGKLSRAPG